MKVCILVFVGALLGNIVVWIKGEKWKRRSQIKRVTVVCLLFAGMGILAGYTQEELLIENQYLKRQENGKGSYEVDLSVKVDGIEETTMSVLVPEQLLTQAEEDYYLEQAIGEIQAVFDGQEIQESVEIQENYQNGKVRAEWSFDKPDIIDQRGVVVQDAFISDNEVVKASVLLICEDSSLVHEFRFAVSRKQRSEEEIIYGKINEIISENTKTEGTEVLLLPTIVEGRNVSWEIKKEDISLQILFLGGVVVLLLPSLERQQEKDREKKREEQLLQEYPEMVNKLALLMGAGMSLQRAWERIVTGYQEALRKKEISQNVLYEEMLVTWREMKSGKGELKSYEAFGERCKVQRYRKFSNYLVQNLRKGSNRISDFLEVEATEMFDERKSRAQQYGEELGTRLLMPMMLMLGIVIFVVMVPAVISFSTGI